MKTCLVIFAAATVWCAEESSRTIEKSFALTGNNRSLAVCGMNGSIRVTAADSNEVRFTVREKLTAPTRERLEDLKKEVDFVVTQETGAIRAGVKGPWSDRECGRSENGQRKEYRRRWDGNETKIEHQIEVSVPRDARLEVRTINGSIDVTGTAGAYTVQSVNGGIRMSDVEGAGEVSTVNGTVVATYKRNPAADTKYRTVNGKLDLYFQPSLNADFHVKTLNGKAFTDFDMTSISSEPSAEAKGMKVIHRRGTSGALRAGNGGPKLSMETVNGSILIHSMEKGRP